MKKYLTEAHAHVLPESKCSHIQPEELGKIYAQRGFDTVVLTNHFNSDSSPDDYLECFYRTKGAAEKYGINIVLGMEIRFISENMNDYLVYGISDEDVYKAHSLSYGSYNEFYTKFKNDKNVIVQAHPFRSGMTLADVNYIDGIEAFNLHPGQASASGLGARFIAEHEGLIATGGSDFHFIGGEGLCATVSEIPIKSSFDFASVLKSGEYSLRVGNFEIIKQK